MPRHNIERCHKLAGIQVHSKRMTIFECICYHDTKIHSVFHYLFSLRSIIVTNNLHHTMSIREKCHVWTIHVQTLYIPPHLVAAPPLCHAESSPGFQFLSPRCTDYELAKTQPQYIHRHQKNNTSSIRFLEGQKILNKTREGGRQRVKQVRKRKRKGWEMGWR